MTAWPRRLRLAKPADGGDDLRHGPRCGPPPHAQSRPIMLRALALAFVLAACSEAAAAQAPVTPLPGPGDPRIREILYDANQVIALRGLLGYEMTLEFHPDERIENVSIGDSLSWQVTPNRKATLLFLKPMVSGAGTSMTVATNRRLYSFLLTVTEGGPASRDAMLRLRFLYPPEPAPETQAPPPEPAPAPPAEPALNAANLNFAYTRQGSKALAPVRVFDDGKSTYFEFAPSADSPAVFFIGPDGKEEMASTRILGRYTVADLVTGAFILRYGKTKTTLRNDAFQKPGGNPREGG